MLSLGLLPDLDSVPSSTVPFDSPKELLKRLVDTDRDAFCVEVALGLEAVLASLDAKVPDCLFDAYQSAYPRLDASLVEKYNELLEEGGPAAVQGLVNGLKGKLAEIIACERLPKYVPEWSNYEFSIAESATQPGWDLIGRVPDGPEVLVQVKLGAASYAADVINKIQDNPNLDFALSSELFDSIGKAHPELVERMVNLNLSAVQLGEDVQEHLATLSEHYGIDLPDEISDLLPYVGELLSGLRLIHTIVTTEKDFAHLDRGDKNRLHVVRTLALLTRFGTTTILTLVGTSAGAFFSPAGSVVGAIGGTASAMYLNHKLKGRVLELALKSCGLNEDDMLYLKHKTTLDGLGASFAAYAAQCRLLDELES